MLERCEHSERKMEGAEPKRGTIIWYNERKGYGFVKVGDEEVFLHHSVLDEFDVETVYSGDIISFDLQVNGRGTMISAVYGIERQKARTAAEDELPAENEIKGIVKFFNINKGYGFIDIGEDERDVFVHLRTLRECGVHNLREGQKLLLMVDDEGKGPHATSIRVIQNPR